MHRKRPQIEQIWTLQEMIRWGTAYFTNHNVDSPRYTIERLLCHVIDCTRVQLYTMFERPLSKGELDHLRPMIIRRRHGEPLQYIVGSADFFGLQLEVTPDVLIPRPETEHLVDQALRFLRSRTQAEHMAALDIGTGSGCIPIAIAIHFDRVKWTAIDKSREAIEVARRNVERYSLDSRFQLVVGDVFDYVPDQTFDLITMNPPYIAASEVQDLQIEVRDHEPHQALTDDSDGLSFYRHTAAKTVEHLATKGVLMVEIGYDQVEKVGEIFTRYAWDWTFAPDLAGIPRIIIAQRNDATQ